MADLTGTFTERFYKFTGAERASIPLYSELIDNNVKKADTRSANEIKESILKRLSA